MAEPEKTEAFSFEFLNSLPADDCEAGAQIFHRFQTVVIGKGPDSFRVGRVAEFYEALGKLQSLLSKRPLGGVSVPSINGDAAADVKTITQTFDELGRWARSNLSLRAAKKSVEDAREKGDQILTGAKPHEFDFGDDFSKVQTLLNELRDLMAASEDIADAHKKRLLRRLEKLQSELHKTSSDLDRYFGVLVDIATTLGTCGGKIKPMVDRVCELMDVGAKVMYAAQGVPMLPDQSKRPEKKLLEVTKPKTDVEKPTEVEAELVQE